MILTVHVKPRASSNRLEWMDADTMKVWVTAAPEKGKANKAVLELLVGELHVPKTKIRLIRGASTSLKQFEV